MTDSKDYRLYLEGKFDALHEKLDTIVEQVKKTNGTTIELGKEDERIEQKVDEAMTWAHHVVDSRVTDCPILPRINEIEERIEKTENDLFEYKIFKRYPKLILVILALMVATMLISAIGTIKSIGTNKASVETRQSVDGVRYYLSPTRNAKPDTLDPDEVIKRMK